MSSAGTSARVVSESCALVGFHDAVSADASPQMPTQWTDLAAAWLGGGHLADLARGAGWSIANARIGMASSTEDAAQNVTMTLMARSLALRAVSKAAGASSIR